MFRRQGIGTFTAPMQLVVTETSGDYMGSRRTMAVHAAISARMEPDRGRELIETDFPEARGFLPCGLF